MGLDSLGAQKRARVFKIDNFCQKYVILAHCSPFPEPGVPPKIAPFGTEKTAEGHQHEKIWSQRTRSPPRSHSRAAGPSQRLRGGLYPGIVVFGPKPRFLNRRSPPAHRLPGRFSGISRPRTVLKPSPIDRESIFSKIGVPRGFSGPLAEKILGTEKKIPISLLLPTRNSPIGPPSL